MTTKSYLHEVRKVLEVKGDRTLRDYYDGHIQRFELTVDMFKEHLSDMPIRSVFDAGTGFPFTSLYYKWTQEADIAFGCMEIPNAVPRGTLTLPLNLNRCDKHLPVIRDLVICTECLEHLPCRHDIVIDWICSCADRALFISVPMAGEGAGLHNVTLDMDFDQTYSEHLKEYSPDTIDELLERVEGNGFTIVSMKSISTTHYQAAMRHILFKRG